MASYAVPPPLGLGRPSRKCIRYRLVVAQHPLRARCCGFGEKDRRPIDPPPIVQLFIERQDGILQKVNDADNISHLVVHCDLYSEDQIDCRNIVYHPSSLHSHAASSDSTLSTIMSFHEPTSARNLMGAISANAYQLMDTNNESGIFFVFPDLSVRTEGRFCLRFMFIDLSVGEPMTMSTQIQNQTFTEPFTVYTAKNFPGMTESTNLSRCFALQGVKIAIRKGTRIKQPSNHLFHTDQTRRNIILPAINQSIKPNTNLDGNLNLNDTHTLHRTEPVIQQQTYTRISISTVLSSDNNTS
ncbi:velvet factor-domain-containing protein, partial [Phycomyces nitens]